VQALEDFETVEVNPEEMAASAAWGCLRQERGIAEAKRPRD